MNSKLKVLIISKEPNLMDGLELGDNLYEIQMAHNVKSGEFLLHEWQPNLLIIDSHEIDTSIFFKIRGHFSHQALKVIYIDQSYSLSTEKLCFNSQFSHYLLNPSRVQITMRIKALLADMKINSSSSLLLYKNLTLDTKNRILKINGIEKNLSPIQYKLLKEFLSHPDQLILRKQLLDRVWTKKKCSPRSVDAQISKLKKKIPQLQLENIYGEGYKLKSKQDLTALKIAS